MAEYDIVSMLAYAADRLNIQKDMCETATDRESRLDFECEYEGMRTLLDDMGIRVEVEDGEHKLLFCGIIAEAQSL